MNRFNYSGMLQSSQFKEGGALDPIAVVNKPINDGAPIRSYAPAPANKPVRSLTPTQPVASPVAPPMVSPVSTPAPANPFSSVAPVAATQPINDGAPIRSYAPAPVAKPVRELTPSANTPAPMPSPINTTPAVQPVTPPPINNNLGMFTAVEAGVPDPTKDLFTDIPKGIFTQPVVATPYDDGNPLYDTREPVVTTPVAPATPVEPTTPVEPVESGNPKGSAFSEGWDKINMPTSKTLDNYDRIGGLQNIKTQAEQALSTASKYKLENGLSFNIFDEILSEDVAKQKAQELNNFTNSDAYLTGLNSYMAEMEGKGLSKAELQMYYASANGVRARASNLFYNSDKKEFDYEVEGVDYLEVAVKTALVGGLTLGLGAAFAPALQAATGLGNAAAAGVSQGIVSGAITGIQGGNAGDILKSAVVSGVGAYATGANELAAIEGASEAVKAQAILANQISAGTKLLGAVNEKDLLGALSAGMDLAGAGSPAKYVKGYLGATFGDSDFVTNNIDALTGATIKLSDKMIKGGNFQDSLKSAVIQYVKDGGGLPSMGEGGFDIDLDTPEFIKAIGDYLVDGASMLNKDVIKPVLNGLEEIGKGSLETIKNGLKNIDTEQFSKLNKDVRDQLSGFDKEYLQPIKEELSSVNKNTKDQLAGFDKEYLQPIKEELSNVNQNTKDQLAAFDKEYLQPVKQDLSNINSTVRDQLAKFDDDNLQPLKETVEAKLDEINDAMAGFDKEYLQPIKESLSDTNKNVRDGLSAANQNVRDSLSEFDKNTLQPLKDDLLALTDTMNVNFDGLGDLLASLFSGMGAMGQQVAGQQSSGGASADNSALARLNTGDTYEFQDLRENPLLKNELLS